MPPFKQKPFPLSPQAPLSGQPSILPPLFQPPVKQPTRTLAAAKPPPRKQQIDTALANGNLDTLNGMNLTGSERAYIARQKAMRGAAGHLQQATAQASAPAVAAYKKQSGGSPLTPTSIKASDVKALKASAKHEAQTVPFSPAAVVPKLADELAGVGPGLVSTAVAGYHHPIRTAEQVGKATYHSLGETIHHPLRQAGADPLGLLSNLSLAVAAPGSIAGRAGAVADASRAADVGALAKVGKVAKAAIQQPRPVERTLVTARDEAGNPTQAVHPLGSINHSVGALQKHVIDPVHQYLLDHPQSVAAKVLNNRLVGSQVKVGREIRATERVKTAAAQAPAAEIARASKKLNAAEAKAVLIRASGRPAEDWAALEQHAIDQRIGIPKAQKAQLALTKAAMKHVDSPRVQAAADVMRKAMEENGNLKGISEEEQLQRLGAHSLAIEHGAKGFVGENAAVELHNTDEALAKMQLASGEKVPVSSPTVRAAVAERDRIARLHEKALQQDERWHAQPARDLRAPMTSEQAHVRLAALDKEHQALVEKIVPEVSQYGGKLSQREQLRRNFENSRAGKGNRVGASRMQTVKSEERQIAEDKLAALAEKHAGTPWADNLQSLLDERQHLADTLTKRGEAGIFGEKPPTLPRRGPQPELPSLQSPFRNRIVQTGHALETAQARVDRMAGSSDLLPKLEARSAALRAQLQDEGQRVRDAGGFYTPMLRESKPLRNAARSLAGGRQSKYGMSAAVREQKGYPYEGGMLARGDYKTDVGRVTATTYRNTQSVAQARRVHQLLYDMGKPTKEEAGGEKFAEAVRPTTAVSESLKRMANTESPLKTGRDAEPALTKAVKEWYDETQAKPGEDIRYVDRRMLAPLRPYEPLMGKVGEGIDKGNQLIRVGRYLLPRYLQWLPQNFAFTAPRQGFWMARNAAKWKTEFPKLAPDVRDKIFSVMGGGPSHALRGESDFLGKTQEGLANFWNKVNDSAPRAMAWIHEAESAGFHNAAGYAKLATDPKLEQKFVEVTRRANKSAGDYSLTNVERATLKKLVPSWAWDKAASQYVGRLLIEHPYLSRFLATEGSQGQKQVDAFFAHLNGLMPSWLAGKLPLGLGSALDTSGLVPTDTPANLLQIASGREAAVHDFAPIPAAGIEAITGRSASGGKISRVQAVEQLATKRFAPGREIATAFDKPGGMFGAGWKAAALDAAGDPVEQVNMRKAAQSGLRSFGTQAQKDTVARKKALEETGAMIRHTGAPAEWQKTYMVGTQAEIDRTQAKAAARRALGSGKKMPEAQSYQITMQTLVKHGMMSQQQYRQAMAAAPKMTGHQLTYWERRAWDDLGPGKIMTQFRSYYHKVQESKQKPVGQQALAASG